MNGHERLTALPRIRVFLKVLVGGTALLAAASCSGTAEEEDVSARPVKTIEVTSDDGVSLQNLPAIIEASRSADLTFEASGTLERLLVREGQFVRQGQVLARLDQRTYRSSLASAQAEFNNANTEYQRAGRLVAEDAIARNVFEQRRTQLEVARAQLDTARVSLEDTLLRAPFSGRIAFIAAERFENISPQQEVMTLQTGGQALATVEVPATLVANSSQITPLETVLTLDAAPDVRIPATVHSVSTQADPSTQTFELKFRFQPPDGIRILPGMTGTVRARFAQDTPALVNANISVPMAAILSDGEERYVWLVNQDTMIVSRRNVSVAEDIGEMVMLSEGLTDGDVIVGAGGSYLHEGMRIRQFEE